MKKLLIAVALFILAYKVIESNPFSQYLDIPKANLINAQASLTYVQAAKIQQEIDQQNYYNDGVAANVVAMTVTGKGITPAENIGTVLFTIGMILVVLFGAIIGIFGLLILIRLTASKTTIV